MTDVFVKVQTGANTYELVPTKNTFESKLVEAGGVVGPQGPPGPRGMDGDIGPQGPQGADRLYVDGGTPASVYGGTDPIDGGGI